MANYLRKYFIMGSQDCDHNPVDILTEAVEAGITAFQFREKGKGSLEGAEKVTFGKILREICREHHVPFFINDDVELASILDVDGIHVGQGDVPVTKLRNDFPNLEIGLSISNEEELKQSPVQLVDYVGAGPVYTTGSKDDAIDAVGLDWIKSLRNKHPHLPIVGIGGITEKNAHKVMEAGADGVSVISAITKSYDIINTVKSL